MIKNLAIGGGSNKLLLVFALVLGLIAAVLVGVYLSSLNGDNGSTGSTTTVPVVVAAQDIPAATTVTAEMVVVKAVPSDLALIGAYADSTAAVGQVTQVAVQAGEQITPAKVTSTGTAVSQFGSKTPLSLVIPAGMRAVAVVVSDVASAGGLVRAGDYVDLMLNQQNGDGQSSACYVLQDVQVIAVGTTLAAPDAGSSASVLSNQATTSGAVTVTVAVNPGDASILAAAQQSPSNGSVGTNLWMTLRPFGEHGVNTGLASCGIPSAASS